MKASIVVYNNSNVIRHHYITLMTVTAHSYIHAFIR